MLLNPQNVKLVVGLGNPSGEFQNTYHNAGQKFTDYLAAKHGTPLWKNKRTFKYSKLDGVYIASLLVFMNESGRAVQEALKFFKLRPRQVLTAHDDSDIKLGSFKISFGQSSAGHKGVESIINCLGSKNFWRLRLGIRPPQEKRRLKAGGFVLKKITPDDERILESALVRAESQLGF